MEGGVVISGKSVRFGGIEVGSIAKRYKTPLYVFSERRIIDNYKALLSSFRKHYKNTSIFYSTKTNYEIQILRTLLNAGSNAEVASAMEMDFALKAGFKPSQLVMDGAAWTDEEIGYCVKTGIRTFNADSMDLITRLNSVARKHKKTVDVSYRVFPEISMTVLSGFVENYIAKFGIPRSKAVEAYKYAQSLGNVRPVAISAHIGSMVTDPVYYVNEVKVLTDLARELKKALGITIREINIGGGFGVQSLNYYSIQSAILEKAGVEKYHKAAGIDDFGRKVAGEFARLTKKYNLGDVELILEPGRFIVSDAAILLTKVVSAKYDKWLFINGGINLIPESIFFIRRGFIAADKVGLPADHKYNVAGPTLNTADVLAVNQKFPEMHVGDTVLVLDAGAYSITRSNQFTMMRPAMVYITKSGTIKYLRKAEKTSELLNKMLY